MRVPSPRFTLQTTAVFVPRELEVGCHAEWQRSWGPKGRIFVSKLALGLSPLETRILSENRVLKIAKTSNNIHQTLILYNSNYTHNHNTNHVVFAIQMFVVVK